MTSLNELKTGREKLALINEVLTKLDAVATALDTTDVSEMVGLKDSVIELKAGTQSIKAKADELLNDMQNLSAENEAKIAEFDEKLESFLEKEGQFTQNLANFTQNLADFEAQSSQTRAKIAEFNEALNEARSVLNESKESIEAVRELLRQSEEKLDEAIRVSNEANTARDEANTARDESQSARDEANTARDESQVIKDEMNELLEATKEALDSATQTKNVIVQSLRNEFNLATDSANAVKNALDEQIQRAGELIAKMGDLSEAQNKLQSITDNASEEIKAKVNTVLFENQRLNQSILARYEEILNIKEEFYTKYNTISESALVIKDAYFTLHELETAVNNASALRGEMANYNTAIAGFKADFATIETGLATAQVDFEAKSAEVLAQLEARANEQLELVNTAVDNIGKLAEVARVEIGQNKLDAETAIELRRANVIAELNKIAEDVKNLFETRTNAIQAQLDETQLKVTELHTFILNKERELEQRVDEAKEQAKELVKAYKNELEEAKNAGLNELEGKKGEIIAKSDELKTELETRKSEVEAQLLREKTAFIELMAGELEKIDNKLATLDTNHEANMADMELTYNRLKNQGIEAINRTKDEVLEFVREEKAKFARIEAKIADLDELDFVGNDEPTNAKLGQSWLDTKDGKISIYRLNPRIRYARTTQPNEYAKIGDFWLKTDENALHIFKETLAGNVWVKIDEIGINATFQQESEPDINTANIGDTFFKMNALAVYYLENKSWVQITQKLKRFIQENEPEASKVIELNDIWQKNDEFFIFTSYEKAGQMVREWLPLELVYKNAKFSGEDFPLIADDENDVDETKAQMRDLYFKNVPSEYYICSLNANGDKEWVKLENAKENARFKAQTSTDELKENTLWFQNLSDESKSEDFYKGTLKIYKPTSFKEGFLTREALKNKAHFVSEFEISTRYARANDIWLKESANELYIFTQSNANEPNSPYAWRKIDFETKTQADILPGSATLLSVFEVGGNSFVWVKIPQEFAFKDITERDFLENELKPFEFFNGLELMMNEFKASANQTIVNNSFSQNTIINNNKTELTNLINTTKNTLDSKYNYAWVSRANNVASIDFRQGINFKLNLTSNQKLSSVSVAGCEGKSGAIYVNGANRITGFNAPFNFRITQSDFNSWEVFGYVIINGTIRLVRT